MRKILNFNFLRHKEKKIEEVESPVEKSIIVKDETISVDSNLSEKLVEEVIEDKIEEIEIKEPAENKVEEPIEEKPKKNTTGNLAGADLKRQMRMGGVSNLEAYKLANYMKK